MSWKAVKTTYSSKTGEKYYIKQETTTKNYSCTCKSWVFSNESPKICKHIAAVIKAKADKPKYETYWIIRKDNGTIFGSQLFYTKYAAEYAQPYIPYTKVEQVRLRRVK